MREISGSEGELRDAIRKVGNSQAVENELAGSCIQKQSSASGLSVARRTCLWRPHAQAGGDGRTRLRPTRQSGATSIPRFEDRQGNA